MEKREGVTKFFLIVVGLAALVALSFVFFLQLELNLITGAVIGVTNTTDSTVFWKTLLADNFNRNDNTTLGKGWLETNSGDEDSEIDSVDSNLVSNSIDSSSQSDAKISNNRLILDNQNKQNRPVISHSFQPKTMGILNWSFIFNFQRAGNDQDYELWMQLGNNASLVDPKISDNQGVAVNLKWGGIKNNFTNHSGFGYILGNTTHQLTIVNGGNASVQVLVSLENRQFNLSINGVNVGSSLPFDNNVTIETVRLYTDKLKLNDFNLQEIDDLSIAHTESGVPKLISLSPPLVSSLQLYNVTTILEISVNVTDDNLINEVKSVINYPNWTSLTINLSLVNGTTKYNSSFTIPNLQGRYSVNFTAVDEYQNVNSTESRNFLVNSSDVDNDGIPDEMDTLRGDWRNVSVEGVNKLNITIAGNQANGSFSELNEVVFYDGSHPLVNFSHNFSSSSLDFSKMKIITAADYLIINLSQQLKTYKTVYLTDNNFMSLCVKDAEVSAVSAISASCNAENETNFTGCLGNLTGVVINSINCYDEGTTIKITNLKHSGVKGTSAGSSNSGSSSSVGGNTDSSSENNNRNQPVLASPQPLVERTELTPVQPEENLVTPTPTTEDKLVDNLFTFAPSGAVVSAFTGKSLTPYILDAVMIISILIIIFVAVYFSSKKPKKLKMKK